MRHDRNLNRWWSVAPDLGAPDWVILTLLCALILSLSGCGTMGSPSGCPRPSAPSVVTDRVPGPIPLQANDPQPEDLLDNLAANCELANELRSRLLSIQAWARSIVAMK